MLSKATTVTQKANISLPSTSTWRIKELEASALLGGLKKGKTDKNWQKLTKTDSFGSFFKIIMNNNNQNGLKSPYSLWKCSEDFKKVLYMPLSQTVAELGLIFKRVLWFVLKTLWCVFYSRGSSIKERLIIVRIRNMAWFLTRLIFPFIVIITISYIGW